MLLLCLPLRIFRVPARQTPVDECQENIFCFINWYELKRPMFYLHEANKKVWDCQEETKMNDPISLLLIRMEVLCQCHLRNMHEVSNEDARCEEKKIMRIFWVARWLQCHLHYLIWVWLILMWYGNTGRWLSIMASFLCSSIIHVIVKHFAVIIREDTIYRQNCSVGRLIVFYTK